MNKMLLGQRVQKRPKRYWQRAFMKIYKYFNELQVLFLGVGVAVLIGWGVSSSGAFTLRNLEVVGDFQHLSMEEVIQVAEVGEGMRLFDISLKEVEQKILKHPWVRFVSVRRQIPETLWIFVKEEKPVALLLDRHLYFVSNEGVVFKKVENEIFEDLPVLTGLQKEKSLKEILKLLHFFERNEDFKLFGLSEIHYNDVTGFSITTMSGPMEIKLGRDNFETKIFRLKHIWSQLGDRLGNVKGFDLDYEDRAFVKL